MKKRLLLSYCMFLIAACTFAQSVGIGTSTPNASAQLDVTATNKGVLIPRVTNAQMLAIASPANGLLVYNTDSSAFAYRNATAWVFLKGNAIGSSNWNTLGNAGTNAAVNFIGTKDNTDLIFRRNNLRAGLLGAANTSFGAEAFNSNSTGVSNTATGYRALFSNSTGNYNTAQGYQALNTNAGGSSNTAVGLQALFSNTSGNTNTAAGAAALALNTTGYSNVAVGVGALQNNTSRSNLVAIGDSALYNNGMGASESHHATANTAVGSKALYTNTSGNNNTAIGYRSLFTNTSGIKNTAIGSGSLQSNIGGLENIAIGSNSLFSNEVGRNNVAIGSGALSLNISGVYNTGIGDGVLYFSEGNGNTAIGHGAGGFSNGNGNVFIGENAGTNEAGSNKLYISNDETNAANTLVYGEFDNKILSVGGRLGIGNTRPHAALHLPQTLENRKIILLEDVDNDHQFNGFGINTFIMRYQAAATTSSHVFYAGTSATTSTELMRITGNGEVGIGKVPFTTSDDSRLQIKQKGIQNGIGVEAATSTDHWDWYVDGGVFNFNLFYNGALKGTFDKVTGAYTANSDRRLKKDIIPYQPVLNNVMQLQAYQYHYLDNQTTDRLSNGFMAQDVQKIFPDAVVENTMKDGEKRLGINYQYFTVLAIKGLQEQQQQIQSQEERIEKLEAMVKTLAEKK